MKGLQRSEANFEAGKKGEAPSYFDDTEKSCNAYPGEYKQFLQQQWLINSRQSENKNDECKSPCVNPATGEHSLPALTLSIPFHVDMRVCLV